MKKIKKIVSLLLVTIMVMVLGMTALADGERSTGYTITINDIKTEHIYEAYQIFAGDLDSTESTLSNITWGTGVSTAGQEYFGDAETKAASLTTTDLAAAFAKEVAPYLVASYAISSTESRETGATHSVYTISGLEAGYYLVKDKDNSLAGKDDSYTAYILRVVKNQTLTTKADMSRVEKKVTDINDSDASSYTDWQDSADYDIGDAVPFQLKATLANNVSIYTKYKIVFHDTYSAGLSNPVITKIVIDDNTIFDTTDEDTTNDVNRFTVSVDEKNHEFTISHDDVKELGATSNSVIKIFYTAVLNENAVIGSNGNPNTVYLEYENNPNYTGDGDQPTGNTPTDKVIVFTYKVDIDKVDKNGAPLTGATFKLEKVLKQVAGAASTRKLVKEFTLDDTTTTFSFEGLDDGEYVLTETNTPNGYNTIDPITFMISATHSTVADEPELLTLNGSKVSGEITFTSNLPDGSLSADIVNYRGAELPSTGGIGTTIFYVLGAIFVLGAGVVLVTRKRTEE